MGTAGSWDSTGIAGEAKPDRFGGKTAAVP